MNIALSARQWIIGLVGLASGMAAALQSTRRSGVMRVAFVKFE